MKLPFDRIEAKLQALIEGSAARLFPSTRQRSDISTRMLAAMRANLYPQEDGKVLAPNLFLLFLPPEQARQMGENWALLEEWGQLLLQEGVESGLEFRSPPMIKVEADQSLKAGEVRITASYNRDDLDQTKSFDDRHLLAGMEGALPENAFLIVEGKPAFPLEKSVVNIGRSPENDLVLNDRRVSRSHAQLRAVNGRYLIFDLESTGGTFINGERIAQTLLHPGDVISLAGMTLIYGQDVPSSAGETQELPADFE